ncbi:hypothetical protein GW17_00042294, partial [Ensete ventricosum]
MVLNFLDAENLENDHSLVMLANKLKAVAEKEHSLFSPVLCQQYPEAGIVAAVLLHQLYGKHLRDNKQDEREVEYSPRVEEAQSSMPTGKRSCKERLTTVETRLDILEASLEELYQGQERFLEVESSLEEAESQIDRVESLVDRLTEDTKDLVRHLHEVVAELTSKLTLITRTLNAGGNNT